MTFEEYLNLEPYSLDREKKSELLTERLLELTQKHREGCTEYNRILDSINYDEKAVSDYTDLPFLPVRLFKDLKLKSVADDEVVKTMTSSGTTGQAVSRIYLDRTTSANQQKAMVKIVSDYTGSSRMPMIIIDCPSVIKDRNMFSARGAGILGFSIFGSKKIYALNDDMQLDVEGLKEFLDKYKGQRILLFGFTFMIWQYFYKELLRLKAEGITFDISEGILIHGGGWKKLISEAVSPEEFKGKLKDVCKIASVHDYYGMVEQTGCIYMECEYGHLHASNLSDVIIRDPKDFSVCEIGKRGIMQVVSSIPESYPGHSLLTEDEGMILGEDDCPCGRCGKYFKIFGRLKNAEIRGCSDTFAADHSRTQDTLAGITYLVGKQEIMATMADVPPMEPFSEEVIDFLNDLSSTLMKDKDAKAYPDIVTLGFWIRKASVGKLKERFTSDYKQIGRGVVFHVAPSNVPVNYAYSLFTGLMCGNANVVRIPAKDFPQVSIINRAIENTLKMHEKMRRYICLVRYERNKEINDSLSAMCDVRVVWGGDSTIADIRRSELRPRATELTFADRYSLAVIDSDAYLKVENCDRIAVDFYNDTYLSDQNACTSPRVVVWTGDSIKNAKELFWDSIHKLCSQKYDLRPIQSVDKLSTEYVAEALGICKMQRQESKDNYIKRIKVDSLSSELMNHRGNSGFFYEYDCDDIMELKDICNDTRCQTVGVFGDKNILNPLFETGVRGIDRVVSIGHTMDFDLIWDGYNLVERLTRQIGIV